MYSRLRILFYPFYPVSRFSTRGRTPLISILSTTTNTTGNTSDTRDQLSRLSSHTTAAAMSQGKLTNTQIAASSNSIQRKKSNLKPPVTFQPMSDNFQSVGLLMKRKLSLQHIQREEAHLKGKGKQGSTFRRHRSQTFA